MAIENPSTETLVDDVRTRLMAQYEQSEALQSEFISAADFAAYTLNEPLARPLVARWKSDSEAAANEATLRRAEAAGRIH